MVFSSHLFLFTFLPTALALYYLAPRRARHLALTVLSYLFYGWANPLFVAVMFTSTVVDYLCGLVIAGQLKGQGPFYRSQCDRTANCDKKVPDPFSSRSRTQRIALIVSICCNLGLLGFFKYVNFAADAFDAILAAAGLSEMRLGVLLRITLPVGISFYTFQSMSYTIDVYRGRAAAVRSFVTFACYVSMFPQLVAGPIIRFCDIDDQFVSRTHSVEKFARGVSFVCCGLAKKVLLANACGKVADAAFGASAVGCVDAWYGAAAYAFQIYFDFSGYSDMAIGLGLMLGFVFPKNFDSPYLARSITAFWRRWHISLSTWLRDYLYFPLGGNRKGRARTYANLAAVMLLGGLWHGAAWNFVVWGGIHGALLAVERSRGKRSIYHRLPGPARTALTFAIVCLAWVFFRADNLAHALAYCRAMIGLAPGAAGSALIAGLIYQPYYLVSMAAAAAVTWLCPQTWDFTRKLTAAKAVAIGALLAAGATVLATQEFNPFIYFRF